MKSINIFLSLYATPTPCCPFTCETWMNYFNEFIKVRSVDKIIIQALNNIITVITSKLFRRSKSGRDDAFWAKFRSVPRPSHSPTKWRLSGTQRSLEIRHLTCNTSFDWSRVLNSVSYGLALPTTARESEFWYEGGLTKHQFAELNETFSHKRNSRIRHLVRIENLKSK